MTSHELRSLRLSAHLSQQYLAHTIGVTASAISQAERGLTQLTDEHARAIRLFVVGYKTARAEFERAVRRLRLGDSAEHVARNVV